MFSPVALLMLWAVGAAVAAAGPTVFTVRHVDVARAEGNHTLCPYHVVEDLNHNREPISIKHIKCAAPVLELDPATGLMMDNTVLRGQCKDLGGGKQRAECVELRDRVSVFYKSLNTHRTETVPIGCTCMFLELTEECSEEDI